MPSLGANSLHSYARLGGSVWKKPIMPYGGFSIVQKEYEYQSSLDSMILSPSF